MDPPLANAVTHFFTQEPSNWPKLVDALATNLVELPVKDLKGERGELFTRFICLITRDIAWEVQKRLAEEETAVRTSSPILLSLFLETLLPHPDGASSKSWKHLQLSSLTDETGSKAKTLKDILKHAYINFTHFQAADHSLKKETMPALLHNLLRQSAALICKPGQAAWDLLILYYNGDPKQAFNWDNVSAIAIQVKNRSRSETDFFANFRKIQNETSLEEGMSLEDFEWYNYFGNLKLKTSPLITILCEVGRNPGPKTKRVQKKIIKNHNNVFGLRLIGATEGTYGCLKNNVTLQNAFKTLLGTPADRFVGYSEYESRIMAGNNILFENNRYCNDARDDSSDDEDADEDADKDADEDADEVERRLAACKDSEVEINLLDREKGGKTGEVEPRNEFVGALMMGENLLAYSS